MATQLLRLALLALILCLTVFPAGAALATDNQPDLATIDAYIETQMEDLRLPGLALGIVQGDEVIYLKGYGIADPSGRLVTAQTPFLLASERNKNLSENSGLNLPGLADLAGFVKTKLTFDILEGFH